VEANHGHIQVTQKSTQRGKSLVKCLYLKEALKANMSIANERSNPYPGTKTSGIKIRGTGAATKGVMARGPMA
jgi:hypothetical protein